MGSPNPESKIMRSSRFARAIEYFWGRDSKKAGEGRFESWLVEMSDRISFNPVFWSKEEISRCTPLWSVMLETRAWAFIELLQDIDGC